MRDIVLCGICISVAMIFCLRSGFLRILSAAALTAAGIRVACGRQLLGLSATEQSSLYRLIVLHTNFFVIFNGFNSAKIFIGILLYLYNTTAIILECTWTFSGVLNSRDRTYDHTRYRDRDI